MQCLWQRALGHAVAFLSLFLGIVGCSGGELKVGDLVADTGGGSETGGGGRNRIDQDASLWDVTPNQDGSCAADPVNADPADVALYLVLDRSSDMQSQQPQNGNWFTLLQGLNHYLLSASAVQAGLGYFPNPCQGRPASRMCPIGGSMCDADNNKDPFWPIGAPAELAMQLGAIPMPQGSNTMRPAVAGALEYVSNWKVTHPGQLVVPVVIAGGLPDQNQCTFNESLDVQQALGAATPQTKTFLIAYDTGNNSNQLDNIASAGGAGTQNAFSVGADNQTDQDIQAAFSTIVQRSCAWAIPAGVNPQKINAQLLTPDGGVSDSLFVGNVKDHQECASIRARQFQWYYDDPQNPRLIIGCDYTCQTLHTLADASLEVLAGCQTVSIPSIR